MISVSSCGVKLQEVLSGLERERLKQWRYTCTFVAFLNILYLFFSFHLGCNNYYEHNHTPSGKKNGGWSAGDNCIPSSKYRV